METIQSELERYEELQRHAIDFARNGDTYTLWCMIDAGLPVNLSDNKGQSLLMIATYNGNLDTAQMLLTVGAEVDRRNDRGQTPLGGVAFKGNLEAVKLLLEHGADINADNGNGMTPLSYAKMFGRREVAEYLQSCGAKCTFRDRLLGIPGALFGHLVPGQPDEVRYAS